MYSGEKTSHSDSAGVKQYKFIKERWFQSAEKVPTYHFQSSILEITQLLAGCTLHWKFDCFGTIKNMMYLSWIYKNVELSSQLLPVKLLEAFTQGFLYHLYLHTAGKTFLKKTSESTLFHNVIRTRHSPKKKKCL